MERSRFDAICAKSEAGRYIVVVNHGEHGLVDSCAGNHLQVETAEGRKRCWDYRDCDELPRNEADFPWG